MTQTILPTHPERRLHLSTSADSGGIGIVFTAVAGISLPFHKFRLRLPVVPGILRKQGEPVNTGQSRDDGDPAQQRSG